MAKAIALLSGGLDSTLAVLIVKKQDIDVITLQFRTPFDCETEAQTSSLQYPSAVAGKFGFDVSVISLGRKFIEMVRKPEHGYGKNMNPCIDCRIMMLREARDVMTSTGADFIITGEVLGQRPMSQRKDILSHIDKEAGLPDRVLRPLSAKLLKVTIPEARGIVDREKLYDISGRSRKPQMALAREFGLAEYPPPAGGCLLTDPNFSTRLRDLLTHTPVPSMNDVHLLKTGRHFRISPGCKIIVGRNQAENDMIESLRSDNDCLLRIEGIGSPLTLITGEITDETLNMAAALCARYSDAKESHEVMATMIRGNVSARFMVNPADNKIVEALRIERGGLKDRSIPHTVISSQGISAHSRRRKLSAPPR
jgi:tRNA U34 2-thiouridine synthase MnmA/TrmU